MEEFIRSYLVENGLDYTEQQIRNAIQQNRDEDEYMIAQKLKNRKFKQREQKKQNTKNVIMDILKHKDIPFVQEQIKEAIENNPDDDPMKIIEDIQGKLSNIHSSMGFSSSSSNPNSPRSNDAPLTQQQIQKAKDMLGDNYHEYNLTPAKIRLMLTGENPDANTTTDFNSWIETKIKENKGNHKLLSFLYQIQEIFQNKGWLVFNPPADGFCTLYAIFKDKDGEIVSTKDEIINELYNGIKNYLQTKHQNQFIITTQNGAHIIQKNQNKQRIRKKLDLLKEERDTGTELLKLFPHSFGRNILSITFDTYSTENPFLITYYESNTNKDTTFLINFSGHTFLLMNNNNQEKNIALNHLLTYKYF